MYSLVTESQVARLDRASGLSVKLIYLLTKLILQAGRWLPQGVPPSSRAELEQEPESPGTFAPEKV